MSAKKTFAMYSSFSRTTNCELFRTFRHATPVAAQFIGGQVLWRLLDETLLGRHSRDPEDNAPPEVDVGLGILVRTSVGASDSSEVARVKVECYCDEFISKDVESI